MLHFLTTLIDHYGYAAVVLFMVAEGMGIPLPAETMLVTAAAFAGRGQLSIWGVLIAGTMGGIVGGVIGYAIGLKGGLPFIRRYGARFGMDEGRLDRAHAFFRDRGSSATFLGRFIALLRMIVPMLAGVARMPFARFSAYNAAGSLAAALLYGFLGYQFGRDLPSLEHHLKLVSVLALTTGAVGGACLWWRRARDSRVA